MKRKQKKRIWPIIFFVVVPVILAISGGTTGYLLSQEATQPVITNQKIKGTQYKIHKVDDVTYIVNTKTKQKLKGLQIINGATYYLDKKTGKMAHGLKKIGNYTYYFEKNGQDNPVKAYKAVAASLQSTDTRVNKAIKIGMQYIGNSPYVYGGGRTDADVAAGKFDCSAFVAWIYRKAGLPLVVQSAATTTLFSEVGTSVAWDDMQRGDLLITPLGSTEDFQHMAVYLGGGFILQDANSTNGVTISRLNETIPSKVIKNTTWAALFQPGLVKRVTE